MNSATTTTALITAIDTREERDVIAARQRVRLVATELGFDGRDRVRIVAAASAMEDRRAPRARGRSDAPPLASGDFGSAHGRAVREAARVRWAGRR